jgi:Ca2+-binding EF-hand superfamily protein
MMSRFLLAGLLVLILLVGNLRAAQDKKQPQKDFPQHTRVTITKIDAKKGEITVKYTDDKRKEEHKTFKLTRDVKIFDETGRVAAIDVFESGNEALILAAQGQLKELRHAAEAPPGQRLSDAVKTLIEMTDTEQGCVLEVQRIYDMLRKLDTGKNGKIDPAALKSEREHLVAERVKKIFAHLDTNRDGKISRDEAKGLIKEHFVQIDRNGDGFITYEELLQAAQEKHEVKASKTEKK